MARRLTDILGQPVSPPTVRFIGGDGVPPGTWTRHWHYPLPVTPLYADFEFGAHLSISNVVGSEEHLKITSLFPSRHDRRTSFLVVDGYAYSMGNRKEVANPDAPDPAQADPFDRSGYEYVIWRRWVEEVRPQAAEDLRRFRAADLPILTDRALLDHIRALSLYMVEHWAQIHCPGPAFKLIRLRCELFCERHLGLSGAQFLDLFNGLSETTSGPVRAMEEVAATVRRDPALLAALDTADPWADPGIGDVLADYVEIYGHKATDWEYVTPTLAERPQRIVALLRDAVARLEQGKAGASEEVHRRRRALEASLRERLPDDETRRRFDALLRDAQDTFGIHEDHINLYNLGEGYMRYALLEAGRRFAARGLLSGRERVFFLRRPELETLLDGQPVAGLRVAGLRVAGLPVAELADARWRTYEAHKQHKPPQTIAGGTSHKKPGAEHAAAETASAAVANGALSLANGVLAPGDEVRGVGASPGTYEGVVRVVFTEDQFEDVRAGEVLVSPQTTPSWTILFGKIGALVTNDGGMLS
ncbi:MAG TPA: PEP-utilizing enzyme, partial [Chloroflexota bacterium]|nr:PEP-utilizing enzyme [Chloroflexota bacterium]